MFTPYRIALAPARKSFQTGLLFTYKNRDVGATFCTVELEFRSVCSLIEERNGVPGEKLLHGSKKDNETSNKLDPHTLSILGFEPGPHVGGRLVLSPLHHPTPAPSLLCASLKGKAFMRFFVLFLFLRFPLDVRI